MEVDAPSLLKAKIRRLPFLEGKSVTQVAKWIEKQVAPRVSTRRHVLHP